MVVFNNLPPRMPFRQTTIINNNNFIGFGFPMHNRHIHHCGFGGGFLGGMGLFGGLSFTNMFMGTLGNIFGFGNNTQQYYPSMNYNPVNNCNCPNYSTQLNAITNELEAIKAQQKSLMDALNLDSSTNNKVEAKTKPNTSTNTESAATSNNQPQAASTNETKVETPNNTQKTETSSEVNTTNTTQPVSETQEQEAPETVNLTKNDGAKFDQALKDMLEQLGFDNLPQSTLNNVKNNVTNIYTDENGDIKFNIKGIVHDTDTLTEIVQRYYKEGETPKINVGKSKFHTQNSETATITDPHSGDGITAEGVSGFGLAAVVKEVQGGITSQGEIEKTNKRIIQLKSDFEQGKGRLSWAYVSQNKLMDKATYDKIISEKYS